MEHFRIAASLTGQLLLDLFENRICAIRIPKYCDEALAAALGHWFLHHDKLEHYDHESCEGGRTIYQYYGVDRVGIPYNTTFGAPPDSPLRAHYYGRALESIRHVRAVCAPYLSPIDRLRLELDELWAPGANIGHFEGKKMFVGIGRLMKAALSKESEEQPHVDIMPSDVARLQGQFAANIYLQVPEAGGELELWNVPPVSASEPPRAKYQRDWRAELPESFLVQPALGDLILFNTRRPHAIRSFTDGVRISLQCFLGYGGSSEPIFAWN